MTNRETNGDYERTTDLLDDVGRRTFLAAGSGLSAMAVAGCVSENGSTDGEPTDEETQTGSTADGNFRLLISDMPADIGDFDRLDVSFDSARVFDGESSEPDTDDADGEHDSDADPESDDEDVPEPGDGANDGIDRRRGFYVLDLEGATVDLTTVIGDKATPVFDGELSPGTYEKIELHVEDVEGIVDGKEANVKVPSEKLQITHSFEIEGDEPVSFVFDINVVKRGQGNDYNLTPVISESGVAGEDVAVEEVPADEDDEADEASEEDDSDAGDDNDGDDGDDDADESSATDDES
ncbi:DUF4382 domain-containing protein [Natronolimnohabitans sp. A-GB9]|uniref:DUF4382 domain-containing protein n=1 Tax=Natronolimnohabitans sp. A-GB9 TaxID=3069757 RepID=UPI0027B677C2|nr:DUF4382 domain-containing protein [Natronolimnohabitans sp. A-GB9]MDQ2050132.1 DUF4382 domain-containing protein [Natronolimnohabitans sp. A-GB9]